VAGANYEVNISLKADSALQGLNRIEEKINKLGKSSKDLADERAAAMIKVRDAGDSVRKLEEKGINVSKARFQVDKAAQAVDKGRLVTATARIGIANREVKSAVSELNVEKQITIELQKQLNLSKQASKGSAQRGGTAQNALSSALIGGAFPLLFGQGVGGAVGGGLGGLAGGALGGQFGLALSLVGSSIGAAVDEADKLDQSIVRLNAQTQVFGDTTQFTAKNVGNFAKNLGIAKEEAVKLLSSFEGIESALGREALALIFGDDPGGFERIANATTQAELAKQIFNSYKQIGTTEADRLLDQLKVSDSAAVELALAESLLRTKEKTLIADAKRVTLMDRFTAALASSQLPGGMVDPEIFGQERGEKLQTKLDKSRADRLKEFAGQVKTIRDLLDKTLGFEPPKRGKGGGNGKSFLDQLSDSRDVGEDLIKQLNREIALISATTDEERKKLRIRHETEDKQIKINELLDAAQRITATNLNAERARLKEQERLTEELQKQAKVYMDLGLSQAGLSGIDLDKTFFDEGTLGTTRDSVSFGDSVAIGGIIAQEEAVESLLQKYQQFGEVAQLTSGLVTFGVQEMIDGTKSAEQVFADFLNSIADMLMKTAQQMIAQYIAIGIAKMFAGMGTSFSGGSFSDFNGVGGNPFTTPSNAPTFFGFPGKANGGPVSGGRPYTVGERGPELFVPGASGTIIPNHAMGGVNVGTINITVENTGEQLNPAAQKQIAGQVQGIVLSTLANERRSGGML